MADFSFEQDVAPYASRFFQRTEANPLLSTASKAKLTGDLLDKLEGVKKIADEDAERSLQMEMRRTQLDRERLLLDDARLEFQEKREAAAEEPLAMSEFEKIFDGVADPNEQQKRLGLLGMKYSKAISRSPSLAAKYRYASDAITKPAFTPKDLYMMQRQAEEDRFDKALRSKTEQRRAESAEQRAAREEQEQIDRIFNVEMEEGMPMEGETRPPVKFKNPMDRENILTLLHSRGVDVSKLEDASDAEVMKAGHKFRRSAPASGAPKPPVVSFK